MDLQGIRRLVGDVLDSLPVSGRQVVQDEAGLRVLLTGGQDGAGDVTVADALRRALGTQNAAVPKISVQHVPRIPEDATGRTPLIKKRSVMAGPPRVGNAIWVPYRGMVTCTSIRAGGDLTARAPSPRSRELHYFGSVR